MQKEIMSVENIAETLKKAGFSNTQVRATVNLFQRLEEPYETFAYWLKHGPNEYRRIVNMSLPPMEQIALQTHAQLLKKCILKSSQRCILIVITRKKPNRKAPLWVSIAWQCTRIS